MADVTTKYNLGPVKPWVEKAAYIIGPRFGIKTIYGWRKTDPFPDHPSGHALDFMTPNKAAGDALAAFAVQNYKALGIKYVIWYKQYWDPSTGWVPYTQAGQPPHTDHVHITFLDTPGSATSGPVALGLTSTSGTALTSAPSTGNGDTCAWKIDVSLIPTYCILSKVQVRVITGIGLMTFGGVVFIGGIVLLTVYGLGKGSGAARALPLVGKLVR